MLAEVRMEVEKGTENSSGSLKEPLVQDEDLDESSRDRDLRRRAALLIGFLVLINVALLILLLLVTAKYPAILSPGILAFSFGPGSASRLRKMCLVLILAFSC